MRHPFRGLRAPTMASPARQAQAHDRPGLRMPLAALAAAAMLAACGGGDDAAAPLAPAPQANAKGLCDGFLGRSIEGAVVTKASFVAAASNLPEHCVVVGEMPQDLDFQVRLPTDWNRRTVFMGGGGFDGTLAGTPQSPDLETRGYVTISTNHGHNADTTPGATFALDPQMMADYANLSVPRVLAPVKAILRERYGDAYAGTRMVYEGCSGGGRQGLIQAQRYPDLFDGVISRAPANAYTPQFLWYQKVEKQLAQPGAALNPAKVQAIADAVLAKCDMLDGLADKVIGRPDACNFDPAELACTGAELDACLTPPQVQSAKAFYAPTSVAGGRYAWPGFPAGGEFSKGLFNGLPVFGWTTPFRTILGEGYVKYMVAQSPSVDWLNLDPAQYTSRIDQLVTMVDAVDPDLSRFKASGGKLLLWTGLADWLITANNATEYYKSVVQKSGGQAAADEFVEYYTAPGVQHCAGGTGADQVDLVTPMFEWLEKGTKPSSAQIIARQSALADVEPGAKPASRPLCRYPQYPRYVGGDPSVAASFACTSP